MKNFDEKRQQLKAAGWNRRDRHNEERWIPPWDGDGMEPMSMTFEQAWRRFRGSDVVCQCGHAAVRHHYGRGMCEAPSGGSANVCLCRRFKRPVEKVEEPLPCPFCGSEAEEMGGGFICTNEYCPAACGSNQIMRGRAAKLRQWNKRVKAKKVSAEHKPREKDEEFGGNGLERTDDRE